MRYTPNKKDAIIKDIEYGIITLEEAMKVHNISHEEWQEWLKKLDEHGLRGLRASYPKCTTLSKRYGNQ